MNPTRLQLWPTPHDRCNLSPSADFRCSQLAPQLPVHLSLAAVSARRVAIACRPRRYCGWSACHAGRRKGLPLAPAAAPYGTPPIRSRDYPHATERDLHCPRCAPSGEFAHTWWTPRAAPSLSAWIRTLTCQSVLHWRQHCVKGCSRSGSAPWSRHRARASLDRKLHIGRRAKHAGCAHSTPPRARKALLTDTGRL